MNRPATLAAGLFLALTTAAAAQHGHDDVEIKTLPVADGLYMLQGQGGNLGVSVGGDGTLLIDDQFAPLSEKITAAVAELTELSGDPAVTWVINTHHHGDHTGGNANFASAGATIVAHENVRARLLAKHGEDSAALPVITFDHAVTFHWNDQAIRVIHPGGPAHTDGDGVVYFPDANVIHAGDLLFNGMYPFIDLDGGGDLDGYLAAQQAILDHADDKTKIIPGHGPLATKADLQRCHDMLKDVRRRVQKLIDAGHDEAAVLAAGPLADLNDDWSWGFIDGAKMTQAAYRSLTR